MAKQRITLNLSGTQDATKSGDFSPLPKGWYEAVVYSAEDKKTSKDKGENPYIRARLNITQEGDYYKRVVFDNFIALYNTEKADWLTNKAEQLARITGIWNGEDRSAVVLPDAEDITSVEVEVYIVQTRDDYAEEQYEKENGEPPAEPIYRNEVRGYRPRGGWPKIGDDGKPAPKKGAKKIAL